MLSTSYAFEYSEKYEKLKVIRSEIINYINLIQYKLVFCLQKREATYSESNEHINGQGMC